MQFFALDALDGALGKLDPGKPYLVHGHDESDLLAFSLQFALASGDGGSGALVTDREDQALLEVADALGLDLRRLVASGRLTILRTQPFVGEKLLCLGSGERVVHELKALLPDPFPERIAFCPLQPLLSFGAPDDFGESLTRFQEAIGGIRSTVLLALPERDPRFDATVLGRARKISHGVLRLATDADGSRTLTCDKGWREGQVGARFVYTLRRGAGLQVTALNRSSPAIEPTGEARRLLVFTSGGRTPAGLATELRALYEVDEVTDDDRAIQLLLSGRYGLLVFANSDRERVLTFLRHLRLQDLSMPVLLLTSPVKRATDRSALLLYGVDTLLYEPVHVEDVVVRVGQMMQSSHLRPSYRLTRDFIRLHEQTRELIQSGQGLDPDTGLWQVPVFLQLARLHLAESHILARRLLLAGFRVQGHETSPSVDIARAVRGSLRKQDPITLLPSGLFVVLAEPSGDDTLTILAAKIEAGLATVVSEAPTLRVASVFYPTDGASIEALLDGLDTRMSPP